MASANDLRALKIATGVVRRLHKEIGSYEKEAAKQQAKVQELEEKEACSHDIAQQKKVLQESVDMIPDTKRRLGIAVEELEEMVETERKKSSDGSEELEVATALIQQIKAE